MLHINKLALLSLVGLSLVIISSNGLSVSCHSVVESEPKVEVKAEDTKTNPDDQVSDEIYDYAEDFLEPELDDAQSHGSSSSLDVPRELADLQLDDQTTKRGIFGHLAHAAGQTIQPAKQYVNLLYRYHAWFAKHNRVAKELEARDAPISIRPARQVLVLEYAKMYEQSKSSCPMEDGKDTEKSDMVWLLLNTLVEKIEKKTETLEKKLEADEELEVDDELILDANTNSNAYELETVKEAMATTRSMGLQMAKNLAFNESKKLAHLMATRLVTSMIVGNAGLPSYIRVIEPLLLLMSSGDIGWTQMYFNNVKFRLVLSGLNRFVNNLPCFNNRKRDLELIGDKKDL